MFGQLGGLPQLQNPTDLQNLLTLLSQLQLQDPEDLQNLLDQLGTSPMAIENLKALLEQLLLKLPN